MLGMGKVVGPTINGTLEFAVHNESKCEFMGRPIYYSSAPNTHLTPPPHNPCLSDQYLWDTATNSWATSDTVRNVLIMGSGNASFEDSKLIHNEFMTVTGATIGPELGIGWTLRNFTDQPTMLLKACIGDRSLGWDLLPPGSPGFDYVDPKNASHITTYAGYHESPNSWPKGTTPKPIAWMAGEQWDGDTNRSSIILGNLSYYYPEATQYEVAGFFWWQGDKDHYDLALAERYEYNLVNLIKHLRLEFNSPNALFVTASLGQTVMGSNSTDGLILQAMVRLCVIQLLHFLHCSF